MLQLLWVYVRYPENSQPTEGGRYQSWLPLETLQDLAVDVTPAATLPPISAVSHPCPVGHGGPTSPHAPPLTRGPFWDLLCSAPHPPLPLICGEAVEEWGCYSFF